MNLKKLILLITSLLIVITGVLGFNLYNKIYKPITIKNGFVYISTKSTFKDIENSVRPYLKRVKPFTWVAKRKKYTTNIKPGKYAIKENMNANDLVNLLRSGNQTPVNLSFNNQDSFEKLAGRIAVQIEADSASLLKAFKNEDLLNQYQFNSETALAMFIPNTYQFFWNTNAEDFIKRMQKEYNNFWNAQRIEKAKEINLTRVEVITLASIVQKETSLVSERPMVAKLYLNRLKDNWPLQADPTVIYAFKKKFGNHKTIKRVLKKDLEIESPYNTYKYAGLPPGPIGMPDISSIDAVLNPANHQYYYMCASTKKIGSHEFAKTLQQHNKNARVYQNWLNKQGLFR